MVIPDAESEHHSSVEGITHSLQATLGSKVVPVAEGGLLLGAEVVADGVGGGDSGDVGRRVLDDLAVLDIETADLSERAIGGSVSGDELGDDGELGAGIDGHPLAEERLVAHTVRVEIATVLVADAVVPVIGIVTALGARATSLSLGRANVRGVGSGVEVAFPDIHFTATCAVLARPGVDIVGRWFPADGVRLEGERM